MRKFTTGPEQYSDSRKSRIMRKSSNIETYSTTKHLTGQENSRDNFKRAVGINISELSEEMFLSKFDSPLLNKKISHEEPKLTSKFS